MNCAARLVEIFGSQADVARAFQLDRAVVHNWVKTGYVPARWAGEVERVTQGRIRSDDVINEASAKNPVRVKSRPDNAPFGMSESDPMSQYAPAKRIHSFHPPQRTLMGPGPTEIHPRVLTTMSQPAIGYLDPVFVEMMEELKSLLRYVYQTKNPLTFPVSGPGSVGMEYCFVNLVRPGDKVIVARNGVFGGRMIENVERAGGVPIALPQSQAKSLDQDKEPLTLSVNDKGQVFLQNAEIGIEDMIPKLQAVAQARGGSEARVYVRGDKRVDYGTMMRVMGRLSSAGFHRVALVTEFEQGSKAK